MDSELQPASKGRIAMTRPLFLSVALLLVSLTGVRAQGLPMTEAMAFDLEAQCVVGANNYPCLTRSQTMAKLHEIARELCERAEKTSDPNMLVAARDLCGPHLQRVERDFVEMVARHIAEKN